jgi:hypothetical protein
MPKSDIPFGSEFSPERGVVLSDLLGILEKFDGERPGFIRAVYERFWSKKADGSARAAGEGKGKEETGDGLSFATNTLYAVAQYGLVEIGSTKADRDLLKVTDEGRRLIALRGKPKDLHRAFARHVLIECHGLEVLQTVRDMQTGGHRVTVPDIAEHLKERGLYVPPGGTHLNSMRQWLALAGVIREGWTIDQAAMDALLGVDEVTLEVFAGLDEVQIAFARALARLNVDEYPSNKVAEYAADVFGVKFPVKSLPNSVLKPLEEAGLVTSEKTTAGRGAKPHTVRPTALLRKEVTEPILDALTRSVGVKYRKLIRLPLVDILRDLDLPIEETHKRGLALEALTLYLTRIIGLEFVGWRVQARETSYAEVDAVVEGSRLIFSRWQIQCKNTGTVNEGDVAKEVGLALRLKSNVVMVVSTGRFSRQAELYARDVMEDTNYHMILLNGADLKTLRDDPAAITGLLAREARNAMAIKRASLPKEL